MAGSPRRPRRTSRPRLWRGSPNGRCRLPRSSPWTGTGPGSPIPRTWQRPPAMTSGPRRRRLQIVPSGSKSSSRPVPVSTLPATAKRSATTSCSQTRPGIAPGEAPPGHRSTGSTRREPRPAPATLLRRDSVPSTLVRSVSLLRRGRASRLPCSTPSRVNIRSCLPPNAWRRSPCSSRTTASTPRTTPRVSPSWSSVNSSSIPR